MPGPEGRAADPASLRRDQGRKYGPGILERIALATALTQCDRVTCSGAVSRAWIHGRRLRSEHRAPLGFLLPRVSTTRLSGLYCTYFLPGCWHSIEHGPQSATGTLSRAVRCQTRAVPSTHGCMAGDFACSLAWRAFQLIAQPATTGAKWIRPLYQLKEPS